MTSYFVCPLFLRSYFRSTYLAYPHFLKVALRSICLTNADNVNSRPLITRIRSITNFSALLSATFNHKSLIQLVAFHDMNECIRGDKILRKTRRLSYEKGNDLYFMPVMRVFFYVFSRVLCLNGLWLSDNN